MTYFAFTLDEPFEIGGIWLTTDQGRLFVGGIACLSVIPVALFLYMACAHKRCVTITQSSLRLPRPTRLGLTGEEIEIPFDSIKVTELREFVGRTQVLRIEYQGGIVNLISDMFASSKHFGDMCGLISSRLPNCQ